MSKKQKLKNIISFLLHGTRPPVQAKITYVEPHKILSGEKVIITGGGRGLGLAMARKFKSEGAEVLIVGRNESLLKNVAAELQCLYKVFDITNLTSISKFISEADELLGGANILVNNAGISLHEETFFDVTPETFSKQLKTNLEAPFFLTQAFIKLLQSKKRKGNILFISSETGETVDFRPYGFTKGAINSMVKGLAFLFKKEDIRINAISPGITVSDMTKVASDGNLEAGNYASGRYYLPEEVAQVASMVLSDAMGCVSGQIITCNNANTVNARWK